MIEYTDLLNTLAQIALGILGFTGVVIALKHDSDEWTDLDKISFQALVTTTLTGLVGALLPQVISILIKEDITVWRYANLGIGILHLSNFVALWLTVRHSDVNFSNASVKGLVDSLIGVVFITCHFLAALGYLPLVEFILILGVIQQLYIGTGNFLVLVRWG